MKLTLAVVAALMVGLAPTSRAAVPVANTFKVSFKVSKLTAGKTYSFTFRLFDAAGGGNVLFTEEKSYEVPTSKTITHLLGSMNQAQPLRAEDFLQQVWVEVSTGTKFFPRIKLGPAPLAIGSQNADALDGLHAGDFALAGHGHGGTGSGLDADLFDGQDGTFYRDAGNLSAGTLAVERFSAYDDLAAEGHLGDAAGDIALNNGELQPTLYAERAQTADSADSANTADALSPAAQAALDIRYGVAPPNQALTGYASTSVDSIGTGNYHAAITIGVDGLPVIAYLDGTNWDLKVLHCGNAACSSGNTATTVDSTGSVGAWTSITIGADGLPIVSFYDGTNADLKVLHCGNYACSSGNTLASVDTGGGVGHFTSIAIGVDSLPIISYRDGVNYDLKVLHCDNAACSSSTTTTVDSADMVGWHTSIAIGADGLPVISYQDVTNSDLKMLHCGDAACSSGNTITNVDSIESVGEYSSITIGTDGLPVISYCDSTNGDLKVLHCGDAACASGNSITTVDSAGDVGDFTSITIGTDGLPVISYRDVTNSALKVLHCGDTACASGNLATTVDSTGDVGYRTSITIGTDGLPIISYCDATNGDLKVARKFFKPRGRR